VPVVVDVQTVSIVIASAGVFAAAIYYIFMLKHQNKMRQTDLVVKLYSAFTSDDFMVALFKITNLEFKDYRDFVNKYGSILLETPVNVAMFKVACYYDEIGTLLHRGLIDAELVSEFMTLSTISLWNKLKPLIEGYREDVGSKYFVWFEYLYDELKKEREQKLQQSKA